MLIATATLSACATLPTPESPLTVDLAARGIAATQEEVGKAVWLTFEGRHWEVIRNEQGYMEAQLQHRETYVRAGVLYTNWSASIAVLELTAGGGNGQPDLGVQTWIENLAKDIPVHLKRTVILHRRLHR